MSLEPDHPLHEVMRRVAALRRRQDSTAWSHVDRGSDIDRDDAVDPLVFVSHSGAQPLTAAVDSLDALGALLALDDELHIAAPGTLIRASIEASAQVVWLLHPEERAERVRRALRLQHEDASKQCQAINAAAQVMRTSAPEVAEEVRASTRYAHLRSFEKGAPRLGVDLRKQRLGSLAVVREVAAVTDTPWLEWVWQVSSGVAHGRPWALLSSNMTSALMNDVGPGLRQVRMSGDVDMVAASAMTASRSLDTAMALWDRRRRNQRRAAYTRHIAFSS